MIDNVFCPGLTASQRVSLVTGCRDNACPGALRQLNGIVPDTAGTARHEHPLISDITVGEDTTVRRQNRNAHTRAHVESSIIGQGWRTQGVDRHVFCCRAV